MLTGRPKNIESPEKLWEYFNDYKPHCKTYPKKWNYWSSKLDKEVSVNREVPITWEGFESWLYERKIIVRLDDYKTNKDGRYKEFADVIHAISNEIWQDQYNGAAAGIYQQNIVARRLGLVDKREEINNPLKDLTKLEIQIVKAKEDE